MIKKDETKEHVFSEFDFFNRHDEREFIKPKLRALRVTLDKLPQNEKRYEFENHALRKGLIRVHLEELRRCDKNYDENMLRNGYTVVGFHLVSKDGSKRPIDSYASVSMPAYGRFLDAYKYLRLLEESDFKESVEHVNELKQMVVPGSDVDLPF